MTPLGSWKVPFFSIEGSWSRFERDHQGRKWPLFLGPVHRRQSGNFGHFAGLSPLEPGCKGPLWRLYCRGMYSVGLALPSYGPGKGSFLDLFNVTNLASNHPDLDPIPFWDNGGAIIWAGS